MSTRRWYTKGTEYPNSHIRCSPNGNTPYQAGAVAGTRRRRMSNKYKALLFLIALWKSHSILCVLRGGAREQAPLSSFASIRQIPMMDWSMIRYLVGDSSQPRGGQDKSALSILSLRFDRVTAQQGNENRKPLLLMIFSSFPSRDTVFWISESRKTTHLAILVTELFFHRETATCRQASEGSRGLSP